MATFAAERPQFFEGQYLGAADLEAIVAYLRTSDARQNLGQHSWGVAIGLNLVSSPVSDTAVEYFVQPGVAIDGYGRLIVVQSPTRLDPAQFNGAGSGLVDVWIRYDQDSFMATRPGFGACSASDEYARINEGFSLVFGSRSGIVEREGGIILNEAPLIDAREALASVDPEAPLLLDAAVPHQELPLEDEAALWLVPLGHVRWSAGTNSFLPLVDPAAAEALQNGSGSLTPDQVYEALMQGRAKRRLLGVVAESVFAAEGLIRLRERTAPADPINGNDAVSRAHAVKSRDLYVCDGQLKPKELVWLEGNVRVTGDARLLGGRLEFRDAEGRDYIPRKVEGATLAASTPLVLQRGSNARGGTDLQLLLGASEEGSNRFSIGSVQYSGADLCEVSAAIAAKVVIQDDGKLGVGTTAPDTALTAPLTVRGLPQSITENPGTPEEETYDIHRLAAFESEAGAAEWQVDLWDREGSTRKSLSFTESALGASRLFLESGGRIGIGTRAPGATLHLATGNDVTLAADAGYLLIGDTAAGNLVLDDNEIQARNNGAPAQLHLQVEGGEFSVHWGDASEFRIRDNGDVGIGTAAPTAKLDVRGNIRLGAGGEFHAVAGSEMLRVIAGQVSSSGAIVRGSGFTVGKGAAGRYTLNFTPPFAEAPVVVANSLGNEDNILSVFSISAIGCEIRVRDVRDRSEAPAEGSATQPENNAFTFMATGPR